MAGNFDEIASHSPKKFNYYYSFTVTSTKGLQQHVLPAALGLTDLNWKPKNNLDLTNN